MGQSLSQSFTRRTGETARNSRAAAGAVKAAVALSVLLAAVALIDQLGVHSLSDHARTMYAPYGKDPGAGLLYGLLYTVAVIDVLLWLAALRATRSRGLLAPVTAWIVVVVTAALALTLFTVSEYGTAIFSPLWGILAALPAVAGIVAALRMRRRD
jgi:hypothetical protein